MKNLIQEIADAIYDDVNVFEQVDNIDQQVKDISMDADSDRQIRDMIKKDEEVRRKEEEEKSRKLRPKVARMKSNIRDISTKLTTSQKDTEQRYDSLRNELDEINQIAATLGRDI